MEGFLDQVIAAARERVRVRQKIKPLALLQAEWPARLARTMGDQAPTGQTDLTIRPIEQVDLTKGPDAGVAMAVKTNLREAGQPKGPNKELKPNDELKNNGLGPSSAPPLTPGERFLSRLSKPGLCLIAEIKRASPSRGVLAPGLSAEDQSRLYARAGARAISVLTEEKYFQGRLGDLTAVAHSVSLPVLRKDFIIDPYQIWESAHAGAHAILLIVRVLGPQLPHFMAECRKVGLAALVETHTAPEVELALASGAQIIGVNCRDLNTLTLDPARHQELRRLIPPGIRTVAESGIHHREEVQALAAQGYDAILVGESLITAPDPAAKIAELLGGIRYNGLD